MRTQALARGNPNEGIRPFEMQRDLLQLADLIELCFRSELQLTGSPIVAELRRLGSVGPLLWLFDAFSSAFLPLVSGYVWIANGQLVGNVTLNLENRQRRLWSISNVAVHPDFRRRGIARQLMAVALQDLRNKGAQMAVLEVQADNIPAQRLYHDLGFEVYDTVAEISLPARKWTERTAPTSLALRKRRPHDWQSLYELLRATTPAKAQEVKPVLGYDYRLGGERRLERWLNDLLSLRRSSDWVLAEDGRITALLRVTGQYTRAAHRLQIDVHPDRRGTIEEGLIAIGLYTLRRFPVREVASTFSMSHPEAEQAFRNAGFRTVRLLDQMRLDLRRTGSDSRC